MKTNFKLKAVALISALLMLLSAFCSFGILSARAGEVSDEENANYVFPEPTPDDELNPDSSYTSLYYFSNYFDSQISIYGDILSSLINQSPYLESSEMHYWGYPNTTRGFWEEMGEYYYGGGDTISNALIIFEVRGELDWKLGVYNGTEEQAEIDYRYENSKYPLMKTMFSKWKENSCKIAFICETDEVWFENNYDEFLDYVDIHINLDMLTSFAYSVADEILSRPYEDATVVFDSVMSQDWFIDDYFLPYLAHIYRKKINSQSNASAEDILGISKINVFFYNGTDFFDISGNSVSQAELYQSYGEAPHAYIIGDISNQSDSNLINLYDKNDNYIYFAFNLYHDFDIAIYSYITYAGMSASRINYHLAVILRDFILNDDNSLLKYDNWSGRCMISFKLIYGSGGWLRRPEAYMVPETL